MISEHTKLDELARERFAHDGFLVVPQLATTRDVSALRTLALAHLDPVIAPAEFEADIHYPGAPGSRDAAGGETPRRLLAALARDQLFRNWATSSTLRDVVHTLLGGASLLAQSHHNCVMTKFPGYSSATMWHQDVRYWSFDTPELVSAWLALGEECEANGALKMIPGSHRLELDRGRFDADLFLRPELPENVVLIDTAAAVELKAGDVVFFDARTFHAAGHNATETVKLSLVFTYHRSDNRPIPGTRSANYPSLALT